MKRKFGFGALRLRPLPRSLGFGMSGGAMCPQKLQASEPAFHAVTIPEGGAAVKVFRFKDNKEGREALGAHCIGEDVVSVIYGHEVSVDQNHTVQFDSSDGHFLHSGRVS